MLFDVFFSICQAEVGGEIPAEAQLFRNFFDQVRAADELGYGTAWIAESHLSCEVQKTGPSPVIPQFKGEIGLNTDVLLLAQRIFHVTKNINVGSAIRSILVNGGPMAHAEALKSFLTLHSLDPAEKRRLQLGFAAGRFKFSSEPYGIVPRNRWESVAWNVVKGKIFLEATEVFLRFLRGDVFASSDLPPKLITPSDFREPGQWEQVYALASESKSTEEDKIILPSRWNFNRTGVIPKEAPLDLLDLLIGSHDPVAQELANQFFPCGVFNLSITPGEEIERTHLRMAKGYNGGKEGPQWHRSLMPRTVLVFVNDGPGLSPGQQASAAHAKAQRALRAYWAALEGTLDESRLARAVDNALIGSPQGVAEQIVQRFHPDDRLMLWFDFFNHDCDDVVNSMEVFQHKVVPLLAEQKKWRAP